MEEFVTIVNLLLRIEALLGEQVRLLRDQKPYSLSAPLSSGENWLDACDVMSTFHISRTTLYRLKKARILKPSNLGGKDMYLDSDIQKALQERRHL